jgi:predicted RND superfamily exporter protein
MSITLEKIDLLRERANVSYQDAKEALEQCNNDLVEALVYLEKESKLRPEKKAHCESKFVTTVKDVLRKGNQTKFIIKKDSENIINLSVTAAVIIGIIATPIVVIGLPVALLTKHKIKIEKNNGEDLPINKVLDKVSTAVNDMTDKLRNDVTSQTEEK